jgi:hypothetical protein
MSTIKPMTEIDELNRRLDEHSKDLLEYGRDFAVLNGDAIRKRLIYDQTKSDATIVVAEQFSDLKVDAQKAKVMQLCREEMAAARVAEGKVEDLKMLIKTTEGSLSAVQTKARNLKTESDLNNYKT